MIFSILFLVLFLAVLSGILLFLFSILLPAMKAEKIGIQNPVFSVKEISYVEKKTDTAVPDCTRRAVIAGKGSHDESQRRLVYDGLKKCSLFFATYESEYAGEVSCAGFGDCEKICPQQAINVRNGIATVNEMCDGCGLCISMCPYHLISLQTAGEIAVNPTRKDFKFWSSCYKIIKRRS